MSSLAFACCLSKLLAVPVSCNSKPHQAAQSQDYWQIAYVACGVVQSGYSERGTIIPAFMLVYRCLPPCACICACATVCSSIDTVW